MTQNNSSPSAAPAAALAVLPRHVKGITALRDFAEPTSSERQVLDAIVDALAAGVPVTLTPATPTPESHKIACISNFHATPEMMDYLADNADEHSARLPFGIWAGTYGCIIAITEKPESGSFDRYSNGHMEDYPNQLCHVAHWAHANGYAYVMFDRDADVVPALPCYRDVWEA